MEVLAEKAFWDARYPQTSVPDVPTPGDPRPTFYAYTRGYDEYVIWNRLYAAHMPRGAEKKVIEIGSAPGYFLVQLHQRFGLDPYGIEYSEPGTALNRGYFVKYGLDPEQVIHGDFFDEGFLARHREAYDVVVSRGFIEHFTDLTPVIDRHLGLLKPGGTLFVTIPNFRGVYGAWMRRFRPELLALHNTEIMRPEVFAGLFDRPDLDPRFCGLYGTLHLGRFRVDNGPRVFDVLPTAMRYAQFGLNAVLRLCFGVDGPEHPATSPFLQYVGVKRG